MRRLGATRHVRGRSAPSRGRDAVADRACVHQAGSCSPSSRSCRSPSWRPPARPARAAEIEGGRTGRTPIASAPTVTAARKAAERTAAKQRRQDANERVRRPNAKPRRLGHPQREHADVGIDTNATVTVLYNSVKVEYPGSPNEVAETRDLERSSASTAVHLMPSRDVVRTFDGAERRPDEHSRSPCPRANRSSTLHGQMEHERRARGLRHRAARSPARRSPAFTGRSCSGSAAARRSRPKRSRARSARRSNTRSSSRTRATCR